MSKVRKGQVAPYMHREEFRTRFSQSFVDPAFAAEHDAIRRLEAIAWVAYKDGRKSPVTKRAGAGFADPEYELSVEWSATRKALKGAASRQRHSATPSRILLINASPRNDGTCPGEISKTHRMQKIARKVVEDAGMHADALDLSLLTSEYGLRIFPCKGCVSTAMPLCHWPCSCYPNHALGQTGDGMADIYERWVAAHGVMIITPVHWYQATSPLKLMMDRLVCADGGNPDPTSTSGKDPKKAKALELAGWDYPKHLSGRAYSVVVHGDVAGIEDVRRALCDWLDWMGLQSAGTRARLDRFIGYYEPYATSHDAFDRDKDVQTEIRNAAATLVAAVGKLRTGNLPSIGAKLPQPRPK
jgi:multimeric flavodoxin WrbA